jgi:hypothetical protein
MLRHHTWILTVLVLTTACATDISTRNAGRPTKPDSRIALQPGGPHQERWQTNDIAIPFEYRRENDQFAMAGKVELQKRIANFPNIDFLRINIHFLDAEGIILSSHRLWSAGRSNELFFVNFDFSRQYPLPVGAANLTFSYTGEVADGGGGFSTRSRGGDRTSWRFWWTP